MRYVRRLEEWSEDDGPVLWWTFPISEPPYVGTPHDLGHTVEVSLDAGRSGNQTIRHLVGGWPGYHTHFTRLTIPTSENA